MQVNVTVKPLKGSAFTYSAIAPSTCDALIDAIEANLPRIGACKIIARPA